MFTLVYIALAIWPLVTIALFSILGPRRGLIASVVGGHLFLPFVPIPIADGLPGVDKAFVTSASALAAVLAFDPERITKYRFHWLDAFPLVAWAGWGISSIVNGLGVSDALLQWWYYAFWAGIPYLLARCYLDSPAALRDLAIGIVVGTMIYAVFAIIEMRFSPQFHKWVYGVPGAWMGFAKRFGGWRPRVFQYHGLGTSMWMAAGAVVAWGLLLSKSRRRLLGLPMGFVATGLSLVGIACRSAGAMGLMAVGVVLLLMGKRIRSWAWPTVIPVCVVLYLGTAFVGPIVPVRDALVAASGVVFPTKVGSLEYRIRHEAALTWHAMKRPVFGWGGWNRNRPDKVDAAEMTGKGLAVTDGFWIIAFGKYGLVGLIGTYGWMLLPATLAVVQLIRLRAGPAIGFIVAALSLWSTLYAFDQLLNGFTHVVQALVAGALASFAIAASRIRRRSVTPPRRLARTAPRPTAAPSPSPVVSTS